MKYALRMTGAQHAGLRAHLFPGDGLEAAALLLCGRRHGSERHILTVREVIAIPHSLCDRRPDRVTWRTDAIDELLKRSYGKGQAIVKIHSHTANYRNFSSTDDQSDQTIFASISSLLDDQLPHASMIMLPGGELFGRILADGKVVAPLDLIMAVGEDLLIWPYRRPSATEGFMLRHAQAFGAGTIEILRGLSIAVIGNSGTGSVVVEQLTRLGVGKLVLVDPDTVEEKNLNRILNSGKEDAYLRRPKVHVMASAIARMGLGQEVIPLYANLISPEVVRQVAECDIVFGCMDGAEGRHLLNRLCTFYVLPYFDVGVSLDADGEGGISSIQGAVHYLQPGRSSLLSREVYTMRRVEAEELRRTNPEMYRRQVKEGYLRGVNEDSPAVISVNMFFASLLVNDFLARLHPYRYQNNNHYACIRGSLSDLQFYIESEEEPCRVLERHVGRGDVTPLLERPSLS